ncbi:hypothetical protein LOTGIDRAFT_170697 [Lottia gigantea]|uniref:CCHC-type domain-containing protein n=1 Tax=Lottia gigantea TaxID=225164 RepID=V4BF60_LOTGI|nr:hypothetical protein LOTGIDRAFT_170697 [Lottia gigantea]ESP04452.1 hypothetical protein LOTGIDRAFT_170697 [Lottia gigantea]
MTLAEDAYRPGELVNPFVQSQLVDIFMDGLVEDHVAKKLIRNKPNTFDEAMRIAAFEQQVTRTFEIHRSGDETPMEVDSVTQATDPMRHLSNKLDEILMLTKSSTSDHSSNQARPRSSNFEYSTNQYNPHQHNSQDNRHFQPKGHSRHFSTQGSSQSYSSSRPLDRPRYQYTPDGRPICFSCNTPGHTRRHCRRTFGIILDFNSHTLRFGSEIIPLYSKTPHGPFTKVQFTHARTSNHISPCSVNVVEIKIPPHVKNKCVLISPLDNCKFFHDQPGLLMTSSIHQPTSTSIYVNVINETGSSFRIKHREVLAVAEVISPEATHTDQTFQLCSVQHTPANNAFSSVFDFKSLDHREPGQRYRLIALLKQHGNIFAVDDLSLGKTDVVKATLDTGANPPVRLKPYKPVSKKFGRFSN